MCKCNLTFTFQTKWKWFRVETKFHIYIKRIDFRICSEQSRVTKGFKWITNWPIFGRMDLLSIIVLGHDFN